MTTEIYAYQAALKTLKERCDYLQSKLDLVEEENCQLKLRLSQDDLKASPKSILDADQSQLQISLLTEQKAKLNNQIQLITSENQKLWSRLSKFASGNDSFDSKISIKDDNHKHLDGNMSYSDKNSDLEISKVTVLPEGSKESLEEISLKLNTLIMDKKGVPVKFPGTIDLFVYKNLVQMENCAFSYSASNVQLLNSFKDHIMKLRQFKQILNNNKNDLASSVNILKAFQKNKFCNDCGKTFSKTCDGSSSNANKSTNKDQFNDMPTLQLHEIGLKGNEDLFQKLDKTCPLCGAKFSGSFEEFHIHVNDHFSDDENDITSNFEVLP